MVFSQVGRAGSRYYIVVSLLLLFWGETMKAILLLTAAFILGSICCGCVSSRRMPDSQKMEYKAGAESKVYHNDSRKDYTGINLSMIFTQTY